MRIGIGIGLWQLSRVGAAVPTAPTVSLTAGNGQISIAWSNNSNGGATITAHRVYVNGTGMSPITSASPYVLTGIANGTAVSIQVAAINSAGEGPKSAVQSATPVAAGAPTPVGPYEAVFDPPNTTLRSTYSMTKQSGFAIDIPSEMFPSGSLVGNGVYWPGASCVRMPVSSYPDRRFAYYSPDHGSNTGSSIGIYLSVCVGDPSVPANWKTLIDAWPLGWVPELTSAPTSNIVFKGAVGSVQPETPWVQRITDSDGVSNPMLVMAYQTGANGKLPDNSTYGNQCTLRATSTDGLNWTGNLNAWAFTPTDLGGPSHTGYMRFAKNVLFTKVPFPYIGFGLGGLYGCNDPRVDEPWTLISRTAYQGVRYVGGLGSGWSLQKGRYDPTTAVMTPQGISILVHIGAETSGPGVADGSLFEALISPDGVEILSKPQLVLAQGAGSTDGDRWSVGLGSFFPWGDKYVLMYEAAGNVDGAGTRKRAMVATGPLRNPLNTRFDPLVPPTPDLASMRLSELDFRSGLPTSVTRYTVGTPTFVTDAVAGMRATMAAGDKFVLVSNVGIDLTKTTFADFLARDYSVLSDDAWRIPWFGFTAEPGNLDSMLNIRAMTFDPADPTKKAFYRRNAGTNTIAADTDTEYESAHPGYGAGNTLAKVRKDLGMRIFPQSSNNAVVRTVWGGAETQSLTSVMDLAGATRSKLWYPFIAFEATGNVEVAIRGWRLRDNDATGSTAPIVATFDPNNKSSLVTLTNGNLTANVASGTLNQIRGVRALYAVPSGRFYCEAIMEVGNCGFGIVNSAFAIASGAQGTGNSVICQGDGDVQLTDGTQIRVSGLTRAANNDVRTMLVDTTAGKVWFGRIPAAGGATVWDGDPEAGTGGRALPSAGGPYYAWADMYITSGNTYKITANFGATSFIGTVPTGTVTYNQAATSA